MTQPPRPGVVTDDDEDASVDLPALACALPLAAVYAKLDLLEAERG